MTPAIALTKAMNDPALFGKTFASPSFWTWKVVAQLIDGLSLTEPHEIDLFKQCTGRAKLPSRAVSRVILLAGRRAGKDRFLSAVAIWRCALCADWKRHISAGEGAVCLLLGADKKQAAILRRYAEGLLQVPLLKREVVRQTGDVIEFRNGSSLEISTNDARLVRGRSAIAVLGSEASHWRTSEYASSSDEEVVGAAEPSLSMCPDGGLLMLGSSVHKRVGYMYRQYKKLHGNDESEDSICWFAPSAMMNPKLPKSVIDKALVEDAPRARAEYYIFREDLSEFIPADVVEAAIPDSTYERMPQRAMIYFAFADAAGGTGTDSFVLAIAHREHDEAKSVVLDVIREYKPRFVPALVIGELVRLLKFYNNVKEVYGDKFGGGFHSSEWQRHGITFKPCENTTSQNYLTLLPMLLSGRARLLNNQVLRQQLTSLERRVHAGDRETVDHPQIASAHDDVSCAAAGALVTAATQSAYHPWRGWVDEDLVTTPCRATRSSSSFC